jgi:hypothetical protein
MLLVINGAPGVAHLLANHDVFGWAIDGLGYTPSDL